MCTKVSQRLKLQFCFKCKITSYSSTSFKWEKNWNWYFWRNNFWDWQYSNRQKTAASNFDFCLSNWNLKRSLLVKVEQKRALLFLKHSKHLFLQCHLEKWSANRDFKDGNLFQRTVDILDFVHLIPESRGWLFVQGSVLPFWHPSGR